MEAGVRVSQQIAIADDDIESDASIIPRPDVDVRSEDHEACVICLCSITERAICSPCNHLVFDFLCLLSWLEQNPSCPLCKSVVERVEYDWRSPTEYLTYRVPRSAPDDDRSRPRWSQRRQRAQARSRARISARAPPVITDDAALARRRRVYELGAYSAYVGANRVSEYRDFTPTSFSVNSALQTRARIFMRRELSVFSFLVDAGNSRLEFLLEYVVAMLKKLVIKGSDGRMEDLVAEFLGRDVAGLFLHELEAWLRSPFLRLQDWDLAVQYRERDLRYDQTRSGHEA